MKRSARIAWWVFGTVLVAVVAFGAFLGQPGPEYVFTNGRSLRENVAGRWDWSTRDRPCTDSTHTIAFSADGRTMTITMDYPVEVDSTGRDWSVTTYDIVQVTPSRIRGAIRGETRMTDAGKPAVWDLVVTGADRYAWRRTDWLAAGRTAANLRCDDPPGVVAQRTDILDPDPTPRDTGGADGAERPATHVASRYAGFMRSNQLARPVPFEISVFGRSDSAVSGWLESGPPLDTRGLTWFVQSGDSLFLVTHAGPDTIIWASENLPAAGRIGGEYWVSAGKNPDMGGTWELDIAPRIPVRTLLLVSLLLAGALHFLAFAVGAYGADRWWTWRGLRPIGGTEVERARLTGVGGWLIVVIVGQSFVALGQLAKLQEVADALGDTWMLGSAMAWLRPLLLMESAFHLFQVLGIIGGLVLIVRRSRMAPPYWTAFLALMALYGITDIAATGAFRDDFSALLGVEAVEAMDPQTTAARGLNLRLVLFAMIWILYWSRSRRVALTFAPPAPPASPAPSLPHPPRAEETLPPVRTDFSLPTTPDAPRPPVTP